MIAKLGFDRAVNFPDLFLEDHFVELRHHLPRNKFAQAPSPFSRRTERMFDRKVRKTRARFNLLFQILTHLLVFDQDMTRPCLLHFCPPVYLKLKSKKVKGKTTFNPYFPFLPFS